ARDSALVVGCENGHLQILLLLIEVGATCFRRAGLATVANGHAEMSWTLLLKGLDTYHIGYADSSLLPLAVKAGHMDMVKLLRMAGTEDLPLATYTAANNNCSEFLSLLIEECADIDVNVQGSRDDRLLSMVARKNH
ncbi:hypothetical protein BJ875DRAFT_344022, partial [Amylocarpus encephaloides]